MIGTALIVLSPYVPMLFQGEEWSASAPFQYFVDFRDDPELARQVAEGRAREFGDFGWQPEDIPNPTSRDTFDRSRLNWKEIDQPKHAAMLQWHRDLIALRKRCSAFTSGRLDKVDVCYDEEEQWLVVNRNGISIVCNFASEAQLVLLDHPVPPNLLLASKTGVQWDEAHVGIPAESVAIFGPLSCNLDQR